MSSISGGVWFRTDHPAVLYGLSFSKIITSESGVDLEDGMLRYPRDIYASFMSVRSIPDACAVAIAERSVSSGLDGSEMELYGTNKLVSEVEVEVVSKEEMEGPTRPVQPDSLVSR